MVHLRTPLLFLVLALAPSSLALLAPEWEETAAPLVDASSTVLRLRFALAPDSPAALGTAFDSITTPGSPQFRQYLSDAAVAALVAPSPGSVAAVRAWIRARLPSSAQAITTSTHGDHILVDARASDVAMAFGVELATFRHPTAKRIAVRASRRANVEPRTVVPASLREHVVAVFGLAELLPVPSKKKKRGSTAEAEASKDPGVTIDPSVILAQYNVTASDVGGGSSTTGQGVAAFEVRVLLRRAGRGKGGEWFG